MKNLLCIFLGLGMILIWSCSDDENLSNNICADDYAEYYYNGTLFNTMHLPDQGEVLTQSGESCGIGAVINENQNILTMRIFDEEHHLNIHADVTNLNQEVGFRFLELTNSNTTSTLNDLTLNDQNFILIEELDTLANTIRGKFNFKIEDTSGDTVTVTSGIFDCSYSSF